MKSLPTHILREQREAPNGRHVLSGEFRNVFVPLRPLRFEWPKLDDTRFLKSLLKYTAIHEM
jgi:hypothetical protein